MLKKTLLCLNLFCLFSGISLYANQEYDIILLAPEGKELTTSNHWSSQTNINESGYVWGSLTTEEQQDELDPYEQQENSTPFIYHEKIGLSLIKLPEEFDSSNARITAVNSQGIAVGIYEKKIQDDYWYYYTPKISIFVYDTTSEKYYDLLKYFGLNVAVDALVITDTNQIIFNSIKKDGEDSQTYIYHSDKETAEIFLTKNIIAANAKGQMIGRDDSPTETSWFYDPQTGYHPLGSLDKFNRWDVSPNALSSNGFVTGTGQDSYDEMQGFIWNQESGLEPFNITNQYDAYIDTRDINDKGQAIGNFEVARKSSYDTHAFLYSQAAGLRDLGTLQNGRESRATGINNQTQVIGETETRHYGNVRAFIWDAENGMRDLTTLIPQNTGWKSLESAQAINDAGYIVGIGNYYGVDHNFLLIPVQPNE